MLYIEATNTVTTDPTQRSLVAGFSGRNRIIVGPTIMLSNPKSILKYHKIDSDLNAPFNRSSGKETHSSSAGGMNCQRPPSSNYFPFPQRNHTI